MNDRPAAHGRAGRLADGARFLKSWLEKPMQIGAVQPSGPALARTMASYVDAGAGEMVVELGPGTGPVTSALLERGVRPERLVLIEFSGPFCELLRQRFPGVNVVEGDAYAIADTLAFLRLPKLGAVVSSLPLLTRPLADRQGLLRQCLSLMRPGAPYIQFTYGAAAPIPDAPGHTTEASRRIWRNIPPARVWVYRRRAGET